MIVRGVPARRSTLVGAGVGVAAAMLAASLTGCGVADEDGPRRVTTDFHQALRDGNGRAACAVLAEATRKKLEQEEHKPCGAAVLDEHLAHPDGDAEVAVFGSMAEVSVGRETVFLSRYRDGWRVVAAGCPPTTGDVPHDCKVEAG